MPSQTQKQTNKQTQNVKVVVNNKGCCPDKKKRKPKRRSSPSPPQPLLPPPMPPMPMSSMGIQPFAPRPVTYAPSSQMIMSDNAPPPPAYFERASTNVENTVTQLRAQFQDELNELRNELMAQQAHANQLQDIARVAQAVQTSFNSMLPSRTSSLPSYGESYPSSSPPPSLPPTESMADVSIEGNPDVSMRQSAPSVPSSLAHSTPSGQSVNMPLDGSDDTVEGLYFPNMEQMFSSSQGSYSPTFTHESGGGPSQASGAWMPNLPNVAQAAAIPLPSVTVNQPQQQSPPLTISSDTSRVTTPPGSTDSGSRSNESGVAGALPNETPEQQINRLWTRYDNLPNGRARTMTGRTIRQLARSMGLDAPNGCHIRPLINRMRQGG